MAELNPYAAPVADAGIDPGAEAPGPPAVRSLVPRVFGILSIVFSGLFVLLFLVGIMAAAFPHMGDRRFESAGASKSSLPGGAAVCVALGVVGGTISLLILGIGQVRYRRWAARGTVIWSLVAPELLIVAAVWAMIHDLKKGLAFIPLTVMLLPYPILLLVFFTRPGVVRSMR